MKSLGIIGLMILALACNNNQQQDAEEETGGAFNFENFSKRFPETSVPYGLSDTGLLNNKDTATIRNVAFVAYIPDTVKQKLVGKTEGVRLTPLAHIKVPDGEHYFVLKATSGNKKAALITVFDKEGAYTASFPFLVPDQKPETSQNSSIDKSFSISRNVSRRMKDDVLTEGKDVYVYNNEAKDFILIMTDLLEDGTQELINPIDTFARTHRFAGDYTNGKRSIVSIRDGRSENELNFFVHFEKDNGDCKGELKGTVLMTSTTTAVFRGAGNPCVLELQFAKNKVTVKEVEGCGSFRGLKCTFDGAFTRKKETSTVQNTNN